MQHASTKQRYVNVTGFVDWNFDNDWIRIMNLRVLWFSVLVLIIVWEKFMLIAYHVM